jgi:hypothetical protein
MARKSGHADASAKKKPGPTAGVPNYPRHSLDKALRIPRAILDQNAGKPCTDEKAAEFAGIGWHGQRDPSSVPASSMDF